MYLQHVLLKSITLKSKRQKTNFELNIRIDINIKFVLKNFFFILESQTQILFINFLKYSYYSDMIIDKFLENYGFFVRKLAWV